MFYLCLFIILISYIWQGFIWFSALYRKLEVRDYHALDCKEYSVENGVQWIRFDFLRIQRTSEQSFRCTDIFEKDSDFKTVKKSRTINEVNMCKCLKALRIIIILIMIFNIFFWG